MKEKILVITGPTGVGKSQRALQIAKGFDGEIVNADSLQVYKYLDVGTAKPTSEERSQVHYHLIDLLDPREDMNAYRYGELAAQRIREVWMRGRLPIIVGGTGLYIKALLEGLPPQIGPDLSLRERLTREWIEKGGLSLYQRVMGIDPKAAKGIHPHDRLRIIRALEIFHLTGKPLTEIWKGRRPFISGETLKLILTRDRSDLYNRIEKRAEMMLKAGLIEETQRLLELGYSPELKPLQSIGYKEAIFLLKGELTMPQMLKIMVRKTKRYAKRQLTWFRRERKGFWINLTRGEAPGEVLERWIEDRCP